MPAPAHLNNPTGPGSPRRFAAVSNHFLASGFSPTNQS